MSHSLDSVEPFFFTFSHAFVDTSHRPSHAEETSVDGY